MSAAADSKVPRPLALLMVDIVGSTALYETMGDAAARRLVRGCIAVLGQSTIRHGGRLVKTLGDGLLCSFESAAAAAAAARAMLAATEGNALEVRIGVHAGDVIEDDGDVFGDAVNTVARIAGLAIAGEVLVSRTLFDQLPDTDTWRPRRLPPVAVKGKREPLELLALTRRAAGPMLLTTTAAESCVAIGATVVLRYGDAEATVGTELPIDIGRDPSNTISIDSPRASRFHARVFREGELCLLQDRSSNGTWIVPDQQPPVRIHRRQTALTGCGQLFFGADPLRAPTTPVLYAMSVDGERPT